MCTDVPLLFRFRSYEAVRKRPTAKTDVGLDSRVLETSGCAHHPSHGSYGAKLGNAREDAAVSALMAATDRHAEWRALDPAQPGVLEGLAADLDLPAGEAAPEIVLRILFGIERVGVEAFALYDIAMAMAAIDRDLSGIFGRPPSAWELTSAVVEAAKSEPTSIGGRLLAAYAAIENSVQDESLSAEGRLADQVFRLHGRLCFDGCPACVHRPSDMMSDSLVESSTSRGMLGRFICVAS